MQPEKRAAGIPEKTLSEAASFGAIRALKAILRGDMTDKEKAVILYSIAQVFALVRRCSNALSSINRAIELDGDTAAYWIFRGEVLSSDPFSLYEEAVDAYRRARALQPGDARICVSLGKVYEKMRAFDKAVKAYDEALVINPADASIWYSKGSVLNTIFYRKKREQELINFSISLSDEIAFHYQILQALQRALELDPENTDTLYLTAQTLAACRRYQEALKYYDDALRYYASEDAPPLQIWYSKAEVLEKVGRSAEAGELYERYYTELDRDLKRFLKEHRAPGG